VRPRGTGRPFPRGISGNPGGRPKGLVNTIRRATNDGETLVNVHAAVNEEVVEVSVADTGVGIAPEDQEAVFEEFRLVGTASEKVEGTGLGLALSRKFIELHGGRIWVKP
jgi:signal transduction histidine kinase